MMPPCTGKVDYLPDYQAGRHTLLVAVPCRVGGIAREVFALLDTASEWWVLPPDLAAELEDDLETVAAPTHLHTRFGLLSGSLGRVTIQFAASEGEPLAIDATCFTSEGWSGPMVIGWKGCLERIGFGLDPSEEAFYFGTW
jgi:hypothetical protein